MSNVIGFLEAMGQDAQLRHATSDELQQALTGVGIDPQLRAAIVSGDQQLLEALLGATTNVCCGLHPAEPDDDEEEDDETDDDDLEEEDDELKSQLVRGRVAVTA